MVASLVFFSSDFDDKCKKNDDQQKLEKGVMNRRELNHI